MAPHANLSPLRGWGLWDRVFQGLTPLANNFRPYRG